MSTAKKASKGRPKPKATKLATKPSTTVKAPEHSFVGHKEGSRKAKVHELFKKEGPESAWVLGLKLKLKEGTLAKLVRCVEAAAERRQRKGQDKIGCDGCYDTRDHCRLIAKVFFKLGAACGPSFYAEFFFGAA